jgi:hypothetical protein
VIPSFEKIVAFAPSSFAPMLTYFEHTFIGKKVRGNPRLRKRPLFELEMWNVRARVLEDCGRTNNSIEAWHKVFEMDAAVHPTMPKLVDFFRLEQKNTEVLLAQLAAGDTYKRKAKEVEKDERLKKHVEEWAVGDNLFDYLDALINILES